MSELTLWRLVARRRAPEVWKGEGALRKGGRWSPPGLRVVYAAESRALAVLEVLVHVGDWSDVSHLEWSLASAVCPRSALEDVGTLPRDWASYPHGKATQRLGAEWVANGRLPVLRVPSAVIEGEFNFLLNPSHAGFPSLRLGAPRPFRLDPRLRTTSL